MRLTAVEVGFFEDHEDEEVLEIGFAGVDSSGVRRTFSVQRSTGEPEEQDIRYGMDSYCVSTEQGVTVYGCLRRVRIAGTLLTLEFAAEDAEVLQMSTPVEVDLRESGVDIAELAGELREILLWGAESKRPRMEVSPVHGLSPS